MQSASVSTAHPASEAAVAKQHAPRGVGRGQVVAVHAAPSPRYAPRRAAQSAGLRITHAGSPVAVATGRQHAPRTGGGQLVALHTLLLPLYTPPRAAQFAAVVITHPIAPVLETFPLMQQAPRTTHVSFRHVVAFPRYTPPSAVQLACVRTEQVLLMQHAPVGAGTGHNVAVHTLALP